MAELPKTTGGTFGLEGATAGPSGNSSLFGNTSTGGATGSSTLFGNTLTRGSGSSNLFGDGSGGGTPANSNPFSSVKPATFGSQNNNAEPQNPAIFGNAATSSAPSTGGNLFGNLLSTSSMPSTRGVTFGDPSTTNSMPSTSGSVFGDPSTTNSMPSTSGSVFGNPSGTNSIPSTQGNMFGNAMRVSSNMAPSFNSSATNNNTQSTAQPFYPSLTTPSKQENKPSFGLGGLNNGASVGTGPAGQTETTTPAQQRPMFGMPSNTPAGPPPADGSSATGANLFSNPNPAQSSGLFSGQGAGSTAAISKSMFGAIPAPLGNTSQPFAGNAGSSSKPANPSSFGISGGQTLNQGTTSYGQSKPSFLGGAGTSSYKPPTVSAEVDEAFKNNTNSASNSGPLFGERPTSGPNLSSNPSTAPQATTGRTATATSAATSGLFGAPSSFSTNAQSAEPSSATMNATTTASGLGIPSTTTTSTGAKPTATATPSMFGNATGAAAQSIPASTFGDVPKSNPLGATTTGPQPTAQSRLKNKSMDEILTRWATDLSKYQKEFQKQAEKVADWDRSLVENSEKVQKLYGSTLEAERATVEVERQLSSVENDQAEMEYWLDVYEKQIDEYLATQRGGNDSLQGPDQERERTYKLAEKLSERLDEMGKDLSGMVEEINASSSKVKNSKVNDPLSQIVRVLNGQLAQLQKVDQGAAELQAKISAAHKTGNSIGVYDGLNGPGNSAADEFYRSYMGRR